MQSPLIVLDSDGCVLDSMEYKQLSIFAPHFVTYFQLSDVAEEAMEVWTYVSLYSRNRGANRFVLLMNAIDLLRDYPSARIRERKLPLLRKLRDAGGDSGSVTTATLPELLADTKKGTKEYEELERVLQWSNEIDARVHTTMTAVHPFQNASEALHLIAEIASVAVVSQTPRETLEREWTNAGLRDAADELYGQYPGGKGRILKTLAGDGRSPRRRVLMVGDAPGDLNATEGTDAAFYPIIPGREEESWRRFTKEFLHLFLDGGYTAPTQQALLEEFYAALPEVPPWKKY